MVQARGEVSEIKGLILRGGKSLGGLLVTGWRAFQPEVTAAKCRKCWLCVMYCPEGAMAEGDNGPAVDLRFCKGCGICANECVAHAIVMVRED